MELIKKEGAYALFKIESELHFVDYNSRGLYTSIFVFGLIAAITLLNVLFQIILGKGLVVSALLIPGLICLFLWRKQNIKRRSLESEPINKNTLVIIDLEKQEVLDPDRTKLGKLSECRFDYNFQFTSSGRILILTYPLGRLQIAKGNPLSGSIKPFKNELKKYNLTNI